MRNTVIVEDDNASRLLLKDLLSSSGHFDVIADFANPVEAFKFLSNNQPDVVFLDVEMPEMSGLELANHIPSDTKVIITTSKKDYAIDAFGVHAFDFILKPVDLPKILKVIGRLGSPADSDDVEKPIFVKTKSGYERIPLKDVVAISAYGDYLHYIAGDKKHLVRQSFKQAWDIIGQNIFVQIHRSHLINLKHLTSFTADHVTLSNGEVLPISRGFKDHFLSHVNKVQ